MASEELPPTLIAVDIGNSRIKLGQFRSESESRPNSDGSAEHIAAHWPEPVDTLELPLVHRTGEFDAQALATWCDAKVTLATWNISSVHRGAAEKFAAAVTALANKRNARWPLRTLTYRDIPLVIAVDAPQRVGIDRLLSAVAADHLRGQDRAAIVVDLGTAIKVDLLNDAGQFVGGAILPGMAMSARALEEQTDALPHVAIESWQMPPEPLGKATVPAIESGLFWGAVGAARELVERLSVGLKKRPDIFVSGGNGQLVAEQLIATHGMVVRYVPHLILGGIALVGAPVAAKT